MQGENPVSPSHPTACRILLTRPIHEPLPLKESTRSHEGMHRRPEKRLKERMCVCVFAFVLFWEPFSHQIDRAAYVPINIDR